MASIRPPCLKAEEVDWTAVAKRFREAEASEAAAAPEAAQGKSDDGKHCLEQETEKVELDDDQVELESLDVEHVRVVLKETSQDNPAVAQKMLQLAVDGIRGHSSVPREIVDACKLLLTAHPRGGSQYLLAPLILSGGKNECELAERLVDSAFISQYVEQVVEALLESKKPLFPTDDALLFWQRSVFIVRLSPQHLDRIVGDFDYVSPSSSRIAGAIFALIKINKEALLPHVPALTSVLNRLSGVMGAPAKKALQQISSGK